MAATFLNQQGSTGAFGTQKYWDLGQNRFLPTSANITQDTRLLKQGGHQYTIGGELSQFANANPDILEGFLASDYWAPKNPNKQTTDYFNQFVNKTPLKAADRFGGYLRSTYNTTDRSMAEAMGISDVAAWNDFVYGTPNMGYYVNPATGVVSGAPPDELIAEFNQQQTINAYAEETGLDPAHIIIDPETGEAAANPDTTVADGDSIQTIENAELLTQTEADELFSMAFDGHAQSLDDLYGNNDYKAATDWNTWLDTRINPDDAEAPTYREYYASKGIALSLDYDGNPIVNGNLDEATVKTMFNQFTDWKITDNERVAAALNLGVNKQDLVYDASTGEWKLNANAQQTADKQTVADQHGVDAQYVVEDPDTGEWVVDPNAYDFDDTTNTYVPKPGGPLDTEADTSDVTGDVQAYLKDALGEDLADTVLENLVGQFRTDDELSKEFDIVFGPEEEYYSQFDKPGALAAGTEASGGLGSGVGEHVSKAEALYRSQRDAARLSYIKEGHSQNLKIYESIKDTVTSYEDRAEKLSRVGLNMSTTQLVREQVNSLKVDTALKEGKFWESMAMTQKSMELIDAQIEQLGLTGDLQTLGTVYQIAVGQGGFDANILAQTSDWYMQNHTGAMGDPLMSTYLALADMQLYTAYSKDGGGNGIAALLGNAAGSIDLSKIKLGSSGGGGSTGLGTLSWPMNLATNWLSDDTPDL